MDRTARAVVIGSGFGGAIAAYHLTRAGIETLVLERGKRWEVTPEQDTFSTYRNPDGRAAWLSPESVMFEPKPIDVYTGILERRVEHGITVWAAAGVGGGLLVYNTVLLQPTRENFYKVFPHGIDFDEMDGVYYRRVERMLAPSQIPDDVLNTDNYLATRVFLEQAHAAGLPAEKLNIASDWNVVRQEICGKKQPSAIAGEIWYGINSGAKNSLDRNYLRLAEKSGHAEVAPLHVVKDVHENPAGGYRVDVSRIDESGNELGRDTITCELLFLGAGSMGTSELLVKARAKSTLPKLNEHIGKFWGNNGDTFATRAVGRRTNGGQGGPATAAILHHDNPYSPQTIIVFPEWDAPEETLTSLGMGIPQQFGEFRYDPATDSACLTWHADSADARRLLDAANHTYAMLDAVGDEPHPESMEEFSGHFHCPINGYPEKSTKNAARPKTEAAGGITAHPLGGAVLGKACDLYGRVQGYKGLYVVDGALIPGSAAACNPAFTIAALAERCMDRIIAEDVCR